MAIAQEFPLCVNRHMDVAKLARALRVRAGLTQDQVAERAGLRRDEVTKVENGTNHASSARVRGGLAQAFGLTLAELEGYLSGAVALEALPVPAAPSTAAEPRTEREPEGLGSVLWAAADRERHTLADLDAVRAILASEVNLNAREGDVVAAARAWLDGAAALRRKGQRVTAAALLVQLTAGDRAGPERAAAANAAGDQAARDLGAEPGSAADALAKLRKTRG